MPIILRKSFRDMRAKLGSTLTAILALTIGLWGIGTLLVSMLIMNNDLSENFSQTNPPHIAIQSSDFDKLNLDELRSNPDIMAAGFRDKITLRIEVKPDVWLPVWLYSVADFEHLTVAKIYQQNERFPPPEGTIFIERDGLLISNFTTGALARLQSGGEVFETEISGFAFDPGQAPSSQDQLIFAYTDQANYTRLSGNPAKQRLIIRFAGVKTIEEVRAKYDQLAVEFSQAGISIDSFTIPKFDEHPHQFQLNTMLYLIATIGLLAFAMAMVLISQLMSSIFTQQIRQIGTMKAMGATRAHIFQIYVSYILGIALVSIAIGLPLAVLSGKAFSAFVAGIINFDILTTQMPAWIYIMIIAFGLLLPIIFSLPALLKGIKISVADALGDYGINTDQSKVSGNHTRVSGSTTLSLSIRNVSRRKSRMIVTVATMALGVAIFLTGFNVRESLRVFLDNSAQSLKYDVQILMKEQLPPEVAIAHFDSIEGVSNIEARVRGPVQVNSDDITLSSAGISVIAAPFDSIMIERDLLQGTWLSSSVELEFVTNQGAAPAFKPLIIGNSYPITVGGNEVSAKLVGVVREFDSPKIYLDLEKFNALANPDGLVNNLLVSLSDRSYDSVIQAKIQIEQAIESTGMDVIVVMSQAERAKVIFDHLNIILMVILFLSLLVLSVSAMGMGSAMGINVMERTREIGVLRAIGATPKVVIRLFVIEGFIISALSVTVGLLLALPMSSLAAQFFGELILGENTPLDFAFSQSGFSITLVVTLLFGYLASSVPANRATNITVQEAIAYE
ncbi:MAG: FtsX-like permease family protein [Xanthomonadales bacterium]|nr:FtsX-like permease family protein [Xanthomonadales bacterium]